MVQILESIWYLHIIYYSTYTYRCAQVPIFLLRNIDGARAFFLLTLIAPRLSNHLKQPSYIPFSSYYAPVLIQTLTSNIYMHMYKCTFTFVCRHNMNLLNMVFVYLLISIASAISTTVHQVIGR